MSSLDVIKFVCRDFWTEVFGKPMDKLQTNNKVRIAGTRTARPRHRATGIYSLRSHSAYFSSLQGVFMLHDLNFRWTRYVSGAPGDDASSIALRYCIFCCGLLRGALACYDMNFLIQVDVSSLPMVIFQARQIG